MAFQNIRLEIRVGNVWSRLVGPAPVALLDRELNPHVQHLGAAENARVESSRNLLFRPRSQRFLTGALPRVKRLLRGAGIRYRVRDPRLPVRRRFAYRVSGPPLRDYQEKVVESALARGRGIVDIGTGGGKTRIALELIARLGLRSLVLVTTRTLLQQTEAEVRDHLGLEPGVIGAGARRTAPVTVGLAQSLTQTEHDLSLWRDGCVIWDEGHHSCAPTFLDLTGRLDARYNFFLSAVPFRPGNEQALLEALTGGSLTRRAYAASYLIERGYAAPVRVRIEPMALPPGMRGRPFWSLYREHIVENRRRNEVIATAATEARERGESVLVLVERIRHGEILRKMIGEDTAFAHGKLPKTQLKELTRRFARGEDRILLATSGLFNEGVSIDGIHCVIQGGGLKSRVKVLQTVGRGMRLAPGKRHVTYLDFFDTCETGVFRDHSHERLGVLREEGFLVPPLPRETPPPAWRAPVPATWSHVEGTRRFLKVDGEGRVRARAECVRRVVPPRFCRRCRNQVCLRGGKITWLETASPS